MRIDGTGVGRGSSGNHGLLVVSAPSIVPNMDVARRASPPLRGATLMPRVLPSPKILVFDSGLGGLTVYRELVRARPDAAFIYAADDAYFPYSEKGANALTVRVVDIVGKLIAAHQPDVVVIACNTASTIVLPTLRARFDIPFIGTVPAIKPACAASASKMVSVLGTDATVKREYTQALIREFGAGCAVTLVGSPRLASYAEAELAGEAVADELIAAETSACFVQEGTGRTDVVVLACTHYPLLAERIARLAPWPVKFIDPAPAIARRMVELVGPMSGASAGSGYAIFTSGAKLSPHLSAALAKFGIASDGARAMGSTG